MPDGRKLCLNHIARAIGVNERYAKMVLDGENVIPIQDCEEPKFCLFWASEVQDCFPEVEF